MLIQDHNTHKTEAAVWGEDSISPELDLDQGKGLPVRLY
jgi:hypothetical protein